MHGGCVGLCAETSHGRSPRVIPQAWLMAVLLARKTGKVGRTKFHGAHPRPCSWLAAALTGNSVFSRKGRLIFSNLGSFAHRELDQQGPTHSGQNFRLVVGGLAAKSSINNKSRWQSQKLK